MEPKWIIDQPVPLLEGGSSLPAGSNTDPVTSNSEAEVPMLTPDKPFPQVILAQETISQSLNTETKTILGQYTFESLGAIKINSPTNPLAGIAISPSGIIATDASGNTTFSLDGTTGNAVFKGIVQASGFNVIDEFGIVSLSAFAAGNVVSSTVRTTTSKVLSDIAETTLTFTLTRSSRVNLKATIIVNLYNLLNTDSQIGVVVYMNVDGADDPVYMHMQSGPIAYNGGFETVSPTQTLIYDQIKSLLAGDHTIKLRWGIIAPFALTNTETATTQTSSVEYIALGR